MSTPKTITIDWRKKAAELLNRFPELPEEYYDLKRIHWDVRFLFDYVEAVYKDAFVKALNAGIPGLNSPLEADTITETALGSLMELLKNEWYQEFYPSSGLTLLEVQTAETAHAIENSKRFRAGLQKYQRMFTELTLEIQDEVYALIGRPCYDMWSHSYDEDRNLVFHNDGDFRILEWESANLDDRGIYTNGRTVLDSITPDAVFSSYMLSNEVLKGRTVTVLGFHDGHNHEIVHGDVITILRNMGAHASSFLSAQTDMVLVSPRDTLTTRELETIDRIHNTNIQIIPESSFLEYLNSSDKKKKKK